MRMMSMAMARKRLEASMAMRHRGKRGGWSLRLVRALLCRAPRTRLVLPAVGIVVACIGSTWAQSDKPSDKPYDDCLPEIIVTPGTELELEIAPPLSQDIKWIFSTVNGEFIQIDHGSRTSTFIWRAGDTTGVDYILIADDAGDIYLRVDISIVSPEEFATSGDLLEALPEEFQRVFGQRYLVPSSFGDSLVLTKNKDRIRKRPRCGLIPPPRPTRCRGQMWSINGPAQRVGISSRDVGSGTNGHTIRVWGSAAVELAKKLRRLGIEFRIDVNGCLTATITAPAWISREQTEKYKLIRDTWCCQNGRPVLCNRRVCYFNVRQYFIVFPALSLEVPVGPPYRDPVYCP